MKNKFQFLLIIAILITSCGKELEFNTPPNSSSGSTSTFAGDGMQGSANGTGINASFYQPTGVAADASGNIYVADFRNNLIRKISPAGLVTTLAGSGTQGSANGTGVYASFYQPTSVAADASGNIYVADDGNHLIREISPAGVVTTLAGSGVQGSANGTGIAASFSYPQGVAVDASGNVYVADYGNNMIREITQAGVVTTLAGSTTAGSTNGINSVALFNEPTGVAVDAQGNVYVADYGNNLIREITPAGVVTTLAGSGTAASVNGTGTAAAFNQPTGVAVDAQDNVYVADYGNNLIREISPACVVTTLGSGAGGTGTAAVFNGPYGVAVDAAGNVYVAQYRNSTILKITR